MADRVKGLSLTSTLAEWWLLSLVVLLLLLAQAPGLLAAGANNLAARALAGEWEVVGREAGLPQCRGRLPASAADPYLATALSWNPADERVWLNRGRAAWLVGNCQQARASWRQAVQAAPEDRIAAFWLFWAMGGDADNLPGLLSKDELAGYAYRVGEDAQAGEVGDGGLAWVELSLALSPNRETAELLVKLYQKTGRTEAIAGAWRQVAATLPEDQPDHWFALGQAAESEADWTQAAWAYQQGAQVAPAPYEFWMKCAGALEKLKRWPEAEGAYRQAMVAQPEDRPTLPAPGRPAGRPGRL